MTSMEYRTDKMNSVVDNHAHMLRNLTSIEGRRGPQAQIHPKREAPTIRPATASDQLIVVAHEDSVGLTVYD
jgi:hypothetical protein